MIPGKRKQLDPDSDVEQQEDSKVSVPAKIVHPFFYVERMLGSSKVSYRGIKTKLERIHVLLCFVNLMIGDRYTFLYSQDCCSHWVQSSK
jgi:IS5 family transposase